MTLSRGIERPRRNRCFSHCRPADQRTRRGVTIEDDGKPISSTTKARKNKADDFAVITIQATHPDYRQQGHGWMTSLMRGHVAFELKKPDYLANDIEWGNVAANSIDLS